MGREMKPRYYKVRPNGRAYWVPTPKMRRLGFVPVALGLDAVPAIKRAIDLNAAWDRVRKGLAPAPNAPVDPKNPEASEAATIYPAGSVGALFSRWRTTNIWARKAPRTREDYWRAWKRLKPVFGDIDPNTIDLEFMDGFYHRLVETAGVREAFHTIKCWRAMWNAFAAMQAVQPGRDPSLAVRRITPQKRTARWTEGETVRLVKAAIRADKPGLACILAVAWDTLLSPTDVRTLCRSAMTDESGRITFTLARAKTGKAAIGTLSPRADRLVRAYLAWAPVTVPSAPMFRMQGGAAYRDKIALAHDFGRLREKLLPGDKRTIADMRRSGATEALVGGAQHGAIAHKLANDLGRSQALRDTYTPVDLASVRAADEARIEGRRRMRANGTGPKSGKAPA